MQANCQTQFSCRCNLFSIELIGEEDGVDLCVENYKFCSHDKRLTQVDHLFHFEN